MGDRLYLFCSYVSVALRKRCETLSAAALFHCLKYAKPPYLKRTYKGCFTYVRQHDVDRYQTDPP
jgi:hypothetical protein